MKPRVALVAYAVQHRSTAPSVLAEHIRRLREEVDFVVISTWLDDRLRPLVEWRRVPFVSFESMRSAAASFFVRAARELHGVRADLVHATLALIPNRVDIASVQWSHAALAELDPPAGVQERALRRAAVAVERWCYGRARVLTAASHGSRARLERLYPGVPVLLTPNGVDRSRFRPDDEARIAMRAELGLAADEVVALFVGTFASSPRGRAKRLAVAIEAFAAACRRGPAPSQLLVAGSGDVAAYRTLADRLGVADRVRFLGFSGRPEDLYRAADILVQPSIYENLSLSALEAAASALPLVARRVDGTEELLAAGAGLAAESVADAATALGRLVEDAALRRRLGEAGREASAAYTWDASAASVLAVYRRLLNGRPHEAGTRRARR